MIFLKYISDAFEEYREKLKAGETDFGDGEFIDLEDRDFYVGAGIFWFPAEARWRHIHAGSKLPTIGKALDSAMDAIERENSSLKGVLPKIYAKENLDQQTLGGLIDLIADTAIGDAAAQSKDLLGRVYEYFLGEFVDEDIERIRNAYLNWRACSSEPSARKLQSSGSGARAVQAPYEDEKGFSKAASLAEIEKHSFILTPGRYVGIPEEEDDLPAPKPGEFYVYIIKCEGGSYYIGQTDNIPRRWSEHTSGKGADWTNKNCPIYIPHYETFQSREEAVEREKELKTTSGRRWIKDQIAKDLARQAGGIPYEEKIALLTNKLTQQIEKEEALNQKIRSQLSKVGIHIKL